MSTGHLVMSLRDSGTIAEVGGKAINLHKLIAAGFPVPDGFVVTTQAYRAARATGGLPPELLAAIRSAYLRLGSPVVAVRSSATAEDLAGSSMAGQYETILDVQGDEAVIAAIQTCWASLFNERVESYLQQRGIDRDQVAMAVVVQRLVRADIAGVLFTANPRTGARDEMVIDASWGLGEAVVSGLVQPDTLTVDRATGAVKSCVVGDKHLAILAGDHTPQPQGEARRRVRCLSAEQVRRLWRLGLQVLDHFGSSQDLEWAIHGEDVFLLQTRAITTLEGAESYLARLSSLRQELHAAVTAGHGPWVVHNLGETVPHPHPLTWSVLSRFMAGSGGFGTLYKQLGYQPSERVERDGFLDLIGGRIYLDCARGPELFLEGYPFAYDTDALRSDPDASQRPPTLPRGGFAQRLRAGRALADIPARIAALADTADRHFRDEQAPAFAAWVATERTRDLTVLDAADWSALWRQREQKIMDEFAPASLVPSVMAVWAGDELRVLLGEHIWDTDPAGLVQRLAGAAPEDCTARFNHGLYALAQGRLPRAEWLREHGHRAVGEFDLAAVRWDEQPQQVTALAAHLTAGQDPHAAHTKRRAEATQLADNLAARLGGSTRAEFRRRLDLVLRYTPFREDAKWHLMQGYRLLRDLALDAGRRLGIGEQVFLLHLDELHTAVALGYPPLHLLDARRLERAAETRLILPTVIAAEDIPQVGEARTEPGADHWSGLGISPGAATGPAAIVHSPLEAGDLGRGYVLVCPSTDPSWTPLFVNAAAVVLERGGTLSHGAVVAREMGVPAVVLPDACTRLRAGEAITVDGNRGAVARVGAAVASEPDDDPRIAWHLLPPPPGAKDQSAARWRDIGLVVGLGYSLGFFLLPEAWVKLPTFSVLDAVLLPLLPRLGVVALVALIAVILAIVTLVAQRLLTDNARLLVAKQRAAALTSAAAALPEGSARKAALTAAAAPVNGRITMAALVPLGALLAPLVASFMWLPERVDVAGWNPMPGSTATITVTIAGDHLDPIHLTIPEGCRISEATPAEQRLPPLRAALMRLRARWDAPLAWTTESWAVQAAALHTATALKTDLDRYLTQPIPAQTLTWQIELGDHVGRFPCVLRSGDQHLDITLSQGQGVAPGATAILGDPGHLQEAVVTYREPAARPGFWRPFIGLGWPIDLGWFWTYILVYLPAMLLVKRLLRVA